MIDSLTSSIATVVNAKRDSAFQKEVKSNLSEIKDLAHKVVEALSEMHSLFNESNSKNEDQQTETLNSLFDIYSEIVSKSSEDTNEQNLSDLSSEIVSSMSSSEKSNEKNSATFESMNKSLQSLVKLNQTQVTEEANFGKVLNKVEKTIGMPEKKTKVIDASADAKSNIDVGAPIIDATKINMGSVAKSMASSAAAALNPAKLVKAFFSELLPYVIIFGLLLYGFITGYLEGDVYDFILALGGIIIAAFLAYIAFQYIKASILLAFQMACEMIKVAMAAVPQMAALVAIGVIVTAFLLVAGVMMVLFAAAFVLIAKGISILIESITNSIINFLNFAIDTIIKIPAMIAESFGRVVKAFFFNGNEPEEQNNSLEKLIKNSVVPKMDDIISAIRMNKNGEIDLKNGSLLSYISELTNDTHSIAGLVADILDNNAKKESEIIKQVASSVLEQNTRSVMNSYQITDGTAVLRDTTAYATSESESTGGTDISQVLAQLGKIVSHLSDIYETEKKIAAGNDKSIWAGLGIS